MLAQTANCPHPAPTFERLFYIQRSVNCNVVVYDAMMTNEKELAENPIKIYWITYEKGGMIEQLNNKQRKFAYGINLTKIAKNHYEFTLVAYDKLKFNLALDSLGEPFVSVVVNNKALRLQKLFIKAKGLFNPTVKYIEFYGTAIPTGEAIYEKLISF